MNHLKSGTAFFGQASYKNHKYNGVELQETGIYATDWRGYMPDIGRFVGMDALAEDYADQTPFHFAMNNPANYADPTGLYYESPGKDRIDLDPSEFGAFFKKYKNGINGPIGSVFNEIETNTNDYSLTQNLPELVLSAPKSYQGNAALTGLTLSFGIQQHLSTYLGMQQQPFDRMAWVRNDRGVDMIGGLNDPAGIFDIAGQVMSTWEPENRYLAMGVGLFAAVALKKPQLALAEEKATYYSVAYEMKLAEGSYPGIYRGGHFREANKALEAAMVSDAKFASGIENLGITIPRSPAGSILGKSPTNWVWHHHMDEGIMQLVLKPQHTVGSSFWSIMHPGNKGGFSIWGK
jgi:RHS repeat-associated protein